MKKVTRKKAIWSEEIGSHLRLAPMHLYQLPRIAVYGRSIDTLGMQPVLLHALLVANGLVHTPTLASLRSVPQITCSHCIQTLSAYPPRPGTQHAQTGIHMKDLMCVLAVHSMHRLCTSFNTQQLPHDCAVSKSAWYGLWPVQAADIFAR